MHYQIWNLGEFKKSEKIGSINFGGFSLEKSGDNNQWEEIKKGISLKEKTCFVPSGNYLRFQSSADFLKKLKKF